MCDCVGLCICLISGLAMSISYYGCNSNCQGGKTIENSCEFDSNKK
jgi:hypothetical protein